MAVPWPVGGLALALRVGDRAHSVLPEPGPLVLSPADALDPEPAGGVLEVDELLEPPAVFEPWTPALEPVSLASAALRWLVTGAREIRVGGSAAFDATPDGVAGIARAPGAPGEATVLVCTAGAGADDAARGLLW